MRIFVPTPSVARELEETAKAADRAQLARMPPFGSDLTIALDRSVAGRNIDPGASVCIAAVYGRAKGGFRRRAQKLVWIAHFPVRRSTR